MSDKNQRAKTSSRDEASRNDAAMPRHRGSASDARNGEQAREKRTRKAKAGTTARKRRPPFVL
jgi:hypothetical protein